MLDFRRIHFIGIGGSSMSALAMLASESGAWVSGSDREDSLMLKNLKSRGLNVYTGSNNSIVAQSDLVVYSGAIGDDDTELKFARTNRIRCMERKAFLALLAKECKNLIAFSGSHGKTTATAMLCYVFNHAGVGFKGHFGGIMSQGKCNYFNTGDDYFVTEACEYKRSFLALEPTVGVILNSDYDHPDTYRDTEEMYEAFRQFGEQSDVVLVEENSYKTLDMRKIENSRDKVYTFGLSEDADFRAVNISQKEGRFSFCVLFRGQKLTDVNLKVYGKHNVMNALAVIAVCRILWKNVKEAARLIESFEGVDRRFSIMGKCKSGARVIADYAHHPREICATIDTLRLMTKGRIVAVFEPHTYSRTKALMDDFAHCFFWTDELIILPTYSAREKRSDGYDGVDLACYINKGGECALYMDSYDKAREYLTEHTSPNDVILVLGAGSVYSLAQSLAQDGADSSSVETK